MKTYVRVPLQRVVTCLVLVFFLVIEPLMLIGCVPYDCGPGITREEARLPERWDAAMAEYTYEDVQGVLTLQVMARKGMRAWRWGAFPIRQASACSPNWPARSGEISITYTWTPSDAALEPIEGFVFGTANLEVRDPRTTFFFQSLPFSVQLSENVKDDDVMELEVVYFKVQTSDGDLKVYANY